MKKILYLIAASAIAIVACKKEENKVSKTVDVSYPTVQLNGDKYVTLNIGQSYDDPGALSVDDITGSSSSVKADMSTLDASTPGLYYMGYIATNSNGYKTSAARYIAVTNYNDNINLEGTYERTSNGMEIHITKVSRGLYMIDDMGGAGLSDAAYIAMIDDEAFDFGPQLSETIGAEIDGSKEKLIIDGGDTIIQYALTAPGYGTAVRSFLKVQ
jgi:hypothetical protein